MTGRIIVDGYNLMYASERLESILREDFEAARQTLLSDLVEYCDREEREVEVVFDAAGAGGAERHEKRSRFLSVTFTAGGKTADACVEALIYGVPRGGAGSVTIVTGDYEIQRIASGVGMLRMSSREFLEEMRDSEERWRAELKSRRTRRQRVRLDERISTDVRAALERFRHRR
ncbi:MAG: NYN domain-containing protein [Actinobacteria bacterium]|nr:NYN domain-containing protein [Actinomycetota bacterium]MCG2818627.1 NYN domain-containing protein [Actinomycetes bacterium]MBU4218184.1 NYN domain-containing protein [Actinomycetota bacterium]MBU4358609.1 NYN domain-containing protein [Actinomycetota bacterium]MBU4392076.1 NYN domain-containing protein [Actinomycetota bacterium]